MKKYVSEVYLSRDFVDENEWLKFILEISKLNGLFRKWKIYLKINRNVIKYYIVTRRKMPTILNSTECFLIKNIEKFEEEKAFFEYLYLVSNKETNIIDIYDKNVAKYKIHLKQIEINIRPYKKDNYFNKTKLIFETAYFKKKKARALFFIPNSFLSMDFARHNRFSYRKEGIKYLNIEKSIELFNKNDKENNILEIKTFPYTQDKYYLNLTNYDFDKHSLIVGGTGTGKSKLIAHIIKNIYENKQLKENYKVVVIDPHSSLEDDIGYIDDSKIINMKSEKSSVDLWSNCSGNIESTSELILTVLKNIFGGEFNSKLERVLRHSINLLLEIEKLNFKNLRKLLSQTEYRNEILRNSKNINEHIKEFFLTDFNEIKTNSYTEAISPIIALTDEMEMLPGFKNENSEKVENIINENFLTIFSLNQINLGEKVTKTIAGFIMGELFNLAQKRRFKEHLILIIDEFAVIENSILKNLLSEARKYNLSVILSQQYFGQVSKEIRDAIFANVVNYYSFRISREDAICLNNQLQMEMAVKNTYSNRIKLLIELANRECIIRISKDGKVIPAFIAKTMDFEKSIKAKNQIITKAENNEYENKMKIEKERIETITNIINQEIEFNAEDSIELGKIMASQSTSRRKIRYE